ncbi:mitochondrial 37S ribosomal protein [Saccharomycopsis crataegensis]|uniref:Mitochondrial 37S ribosomal protein n=1 Tax=Saccharomycopsis crataegensis TaxID=43959 RepID=A0AAV5QJZ1_9ASCO|nr:mitochondrial 37S ribosomal protein [Saccharomycopsis crataegensis]
MLRSTIRITLLKSARGRSSLQLRRCNSTSRTSDEQPASNRTDNKLDLHPANDSNSLYGALKDISPEDIQGQSSSLSAFGVLADAETYGMLVRSESQSNVESPKKIRVIDREDLLQGKYSSQDGESETFESRYLPQTLMGKFNSNQVQLPHEISKTIRNNIIKTYPHINVIRQTAAKMFIEMSETGLHVIPRTRHEVDTHIATVFLQNYASAYQVLSELKSKVEQDGKEFNPIKVLDVGYGPSTGILALNELLGDQYYPEVKHSFIVGNSKGVKEMKDRAKILLSRQLNEIAIDKLSPEQQRELTKEESVPEDVDEYANDEDSKFNKRERKRRERYADEEDNIGPVDTNRLKIRTKFIDSISSSRRYDLIIATHQLLKDSTRFPYGIDDTIQELLSVLEPDGHLLIIERGNPLGFESIARARQIMIRPENYSPYEYGKIPRPWIRGSSIKPQRNQHLYEISEEDSKLSEQLNEKFGEVQEEDLEFGKGIADNFDLVEIKTDGSLPAAHSDFYLSVVAPYPHHLKCPFQMHNPKYYDYPKGSNLNFLTFGVSVSRPKYALEFKSGSILSGKWESEKSGKAAKGAVGAGSGRPNGKNYESVNFNYLVMKRSRMDRKTISKIEAERDRVNEVTGRIKEAEESGDTNLKQKIIDSELDRLDDKVSGDSSQWARIVKPPLKRKGHVIFLVITVGGNVEKWIVPRSMGKDIYHDARKAQKGDSWAHGCKTKIVLLAGDEAKGVKGSQWEKYHDLFKRYEMMEKKENKRLKKEARLSEKKKQDESRRNGSEHYMKEHYEE